jgi:folate-binding protein YgfZ
VTREEVAGRWTRLPERALFRLSGPDAERYLNGQVTNDVAKTADGRALPACLCNLKGRVEFLVWITRIDGSLLVDGQLEQREALGTRLDRYLIADDCELVDVTGSLALVHHFVEEVGGHLSPRLGAGPQGRDLWLAGGGGGLPEGLTEEAEISPSDFAALELRSLVPRSPEEIDGGAFPAELRLDAWAVDFHKGCYLGQEIVSRIESVGRVKRQIGLAIASEPFDQDSPLRSDGGESTKPTRPAKAVAKNFYAAPAWFRESLGIPQLTQFQRVVLDLGLSSEI